MKFKTLYSLSLASIVVGGVLMGGLGNPDAHENDTKKPAKAVTVRPPLRQVIDTVYITDENFDDIRHHGAGGLFNCNSNTVHVTYFIANTQNTKIQVYADGANAVMPLNRRHEMEHARKALMTKRLDHLPCHMRGAVAAMNEIMAPSSEIIELMDMAHRHRGTPIRQKVNMVSTSRKIRRIMTENNMTGPVDFTNTQIADATIQYGMDAFLSSFNRGIYHHTIREKQRSGIRLWRYVPHNECDFVASFMFNPQWRFWAPMWEFDTSRGSVNLWNAASAAQRQKLVALVDSVARVCR